MTILEAAQRQAVIAEAESWIGTPFHHQGRVKGPQGGVDCAMLLLEVFKKVFSCQLPVASEESKAETPKLGTGNWELGTLTYSMQWHLHHSEEKYLEMILALGGKPVESPGPGDIAIWKIGRAYSHGAIVVVWPKIIHAAALPINQCILDNALMSALNLDKHPVKFFTAWRP